MCDIVTSQILAGPVFFNFFIYFGRFAGFGGFACFGRFARFVSLVSVVSFRPFRFVVSGYSTCRGVQIRARPI